MFGLVPVAGSLARLRHLQRKKNEGSRVVQQKKNCNK